MASPTDQIFCANFPGSHNIVVLNTWNGNGALLAHVLCDIPILLTSDGNRASVNERKMRKRRWEMEVSYDENVIFFCLT